MSFINWQRSKKTGTSSPLKICFLSYSAYPLFNPSCRKTFGGAEVQLYQLGKKLSQAYNCEISFIVGDYGQAFLEVYDKISVYRGTTVSPSFWGKFNPMKVHQLYSLMREINADIYVQRTANLKTGLLCERARRMGKKFVFMTAHDDDCNGNYEKKHNFLVASLYKFGLINASLVITQSEQHRQMLREYHLIDSVVMKTAYHIPAPADVSQKKGILWISRLEDWKRPEIVLDIAKKFPNEILTMVAPAGQNNAYNEYIVKLIKQVPNIEYVSYVPFSNINEYFAKAKLFINTSKSEGFPNTFVQAAMNCTPVISMNVNPDNILTRYKFGLCADDQLGVFMNIAEQLLKEHATWETYSQNAYAYAANHHNIEVIVDDLYKYLVKL